MSTIWEFDVLAPRVRHAWIMRENVHPEHKLDVLTTLPYL